MQKPSPLIKAEIPTPTSSRATPCVCGIGGNRAAQPHSPCLPCPASPTHTARLEELPASLEDQLPSAAAPAACLRGTDAPAAAEQAPGSFLQVSGQHLCL